MPYKDKEKHNELQRKSRKDDPERHREYCKRYREKDPEKTKHIRRKSKLKYCYGITIEQWQSMFESQGRKCAICGTQNPPKNKWCTDHLGNKFRGILCNPCNTALGNLKEDADLIRKAAEYVEKNKGDN